MIFGKTVNKYYLMYAYLFIPGIIALIIIDYIQLEIPGLTRKIIDGVNFGTITESGILEIITTILIYVSIIIVGRFLWRMTIFGASRRVDYGIRNEMFSHCEKLSNRYYSENKTGGLMAYFTNDLEAVRRAVGPGMIMFVDAVFLGGLAFYHMANLDLRLTLLAGIPLIIIAFAGALIGNKMRKKFKAAQKAFEDLSDFTNENLSGISVIKAFVRENREIQEFLKSNKNAKDKNVDYVKIQVKLQIFIRMVVSTIFVIILTYGGSLVNKTSNLPIEQQFTVGDLVEFIMLFSSLIWPMMALAMIINVYNRGKTSLIRIDSILNEVIEIKDGDDLIEIEEIKGNITFKNLNFRYPDSKEDVLKNISFDIKQGETVGVLGRTGSGKTSVLDLLLRIYNIDENQLFIDGNDIMKLPIRTVRESIGYVPQDGFLFSDTIEKNVSLGLNNEEVTIDEIKNAAILSDVHDNIVEFSEGYETVIGERGVTLSGGQRQRLSIARALIKNPPILILDDSVSAVDTKTEETILRNLKDIRKGKTTIIIAHRISTLKDSDKIILIDDGTILDVGSHSELLSRSEFYKEMVERQLLEDEIEVLS